MERKILIAEDDAAIQGLLKRVLVNHGYTIIPVYDGSQVMSTALRELPMLILLDLNMPGKKGEDVLQELRSNSRTRMIPVIFETGANTREDVVRGLMTGADDYLCKPFSTEELVARVSSVLRRCSVNLDANPLSRLPGSGVIEAEIRRLLEREREFSVLYVDLNEFKAYNDYYGAYRGDDVISATAELLREECDAIGAFVGHIGGDDFVVLTDVQDVEGLCQRILDRFDGMVRYFYDEADWRAGFIMVPDRQGVRRAFQPVSIAIGVVTNRVRPLMSMMEISAIGAEVKAVAKRCEGSAFFVDRQRETYNALRHKEMADSAAELVRSRY